ncbi:hypothetical protein F4818DRAFT_360249 [Hypoxylon cercidicola]|nr:hypothetical protein F4818DRAFT_360249 [Hypoxylon cercidicola]
MVARKRPSRGAGRGAGRDASTSTTHPPAPNPGTHDAHAPAADPSTEPVYFWRVSESETGFLSQWYRAPFRDRSDPSRTYPTAEHYMMYHKAVLFGDLAIAGRILAAGDPREVRALGRAVAHFDAAVWKRERERVVREANWCKFSLPASSPGEEEEGGSDEAETKLRDALLATGDRPLVEASPFDRIWGIGFRAANAERNRPRWGLNLLGKCLMEVREQVRREDQERGEERMHDAGSESIRREYWGPQDI